MDLFFFRRRTKNMLQPATADKNEFEKQVMVTIQRKEYDTSNGSEFLDDAIRMRDQPFMYTEESVAPGNPEGLW